MEELFKKIAVFFIVIFLIRIFWGLLKFLIPLLLIAFAAYFIYSAFFRKKEEVKWYEGTPTDSYYQKEEVRPKQDVIDVAVKVRREEDDPLH